MHQEQQGARKDTSGYLTHQWATFEGKMIEVL